MFITLGSGTPYTINDQSLGSGPNERRLCATRVVPSSSLHLSQRMGLPLRGHASRTAFRFGATHSFSVIFQGFNIFSFDNFSGYPGYHPDAAGVNVNLRQAEQPARSGPAAAIRAEVCLLTRQSPIPNSPITSMRKLCPHRGPGTGLWLQPPDGDADPHPGTGHRRLRRHTRAPDLRLVLGHDQHLATGSCRTAGPTSTFRASRQSASA